MPDPTPEEVKSVIPLWETFCSHPNPSGLTRFGHECVDCVAELVKERTEKVRQESQLQWAPVPVERNSFITQIQTMQAQLAEKEVEIGRLEKGLELALSDKHPKAVAVKDGQIHYMVEGKYLSIKQIATLTAEVGRLREALSLISSEARAKVWDVATHKQVTEQMIATINYCKKISGDALSSPPAETGRTE